MALNLFSPCTPFFGARLPSNTKSTSLSTQTVEPMVVRRSANYHSSVWEDNLVQSLKSNYEDDRHIIRHNELKEEASCLLKQATGPVVQLELIDDIQRLGIGYLFEKEIKEMLITIFIGVKSSDLGIGDDLYTVALCFRLLRENGFNVSQDIFKAFMDESGSFNTSICVDVKALLSLYEASYVGFEGETFLDEAKKFTTMHLNSVKGNIDDILTKQVEHSLDIPLHRRMPKLEARWYIEEIYERKEDMSPTLLELAKLDYNMVQSIYQEDVKNMSSWWKKLGLGEKLNYTRDRLVECFLWAIALMPHPQFRHCRQEFTKVNQLITTLDDVYDVHGTLDELERFTDAIERWDTDAIEELPNYMQICYMAIFNTANNLGYLNLKEQGVNTIPCLKKAWTDLCKAYLTEARWYHSGDVPTLEEYLNNGWISSSVHVGFAHGYVSMDQKITKEALECLENRPDPIRGSAMGSRLIDDWGTSVDEVARGDVQKSIQCYMHENGASEAVAREHIWVLIDKAWKRMNEDQVLPSPFPKQLMDSIINVVRMCHGYYQHGDGLGISDGKTKDNLKFFSVNYSLLKKLDKIEKFHIKSE